MSDTAPPPALVEPDPDAESILPTPLAPRRRRRRWVAGLAVGLAVVTVAALAVVGTRANAGIRATEEAQDRWVAEAEAAFESIPLLSDDEIATLRRSRNDRHVELAESLGVGPPDTRGEADSLAQRYDFVRVATDSLYVVLPTTASLPLLTPSAAASLDSIAVRFRDRLATVGLPPFRFAVSSLWRTGADQAALRGRNVNAAAGRSSHEYGTTYDITYNPTRYSPAPDALPPPPRVDPRVPGFLEPTVRERLIREQRDALDRLAADYPSRLTAALGRALIELEDEGVLVVVRERRQPVYHVTVARRLVPRP
ncbi:DUF5715 family protein [Rubrivirga sp.]|uniref:DUF5715 family protein n=1 Tax=Rubrivirga sp. TaxID=1885344 RepID=UPI003B52DB4E